MMTDNNGLISKMGERKQASKTLNHIALAEKEKTTEAEDTEVDVVVEEPIKVKKAFTAAKVIEVPPNCKEGEEMDKNGQCRRPF